jgi:murein DD-endopeptidase MepM/ murein hydrolase activator NlpD
MRSRSLAGAVALLLALPALGGATSLSSRIQEKQRQVDAQRAKEGVLTADIRGFSDRIGSLQADITSLQAKESRLQADLDGKLARLAAIQRELRTERARLARLRAKLVVGQRLLSARLVELYKADSPDLMTVVLNSHGFADLLENSEFARRIGRQDNRIITAVREAKRESTVSAERLAGLAADARQLAAVVQDRRDEVADVKGDLVSRRDDYARARDRKNAVLASVRGDRQDLEGDLKDLQAQEARIQARLAGGPATVGPVRAGSGGLIWPVNGPIVSGFGMRWGRLHAGVDIAVPSGTPVHAAASGSVRIAGWVSGYGNYVCIQHSGPLSTCYGHNTSLAVSVGQSVSQGQVISSSGCTGHCYGPHVHFETRINGAPVDPMGYL